MSLVPRLTPEQLDELFADVVRQLEVEAAKPLPDAERVLDLASRLNMLRFLMAAEAKPEQDKRGG